MSNSDKKSIEYPARLIWLGVGIAGGISLFVAAFIFATEIFLILALAILFGVFLTKMSALIERKIPLGYSWSLGIVTTSLILVFILGVGLFGVQVSVQANKAQKHFGEAQSRIEEFAKNNSTARSLISSTPFLREMISTDSGMNKTSQEEKESESDAKNSTDNKNSQKAAPLVEKSALQNTAKKGLDVIGGIFKTTFGLVLNSMLIFFVGLFIAIMPDAYRDGIVVLLPIDRRERTREILNIVGDTLWSWLLGRFGSMLVTGVGAGVILLILGVPMAITLGIVTGLLTFIPNIGGLISLILAILFSLPQGLTVVVAVVVGYMVLQLIESYVVTPLIQQKQVSLPPALLIAFQAVMGVLFGFLGAAVASPLLAASKIFVLEAYVKDILEKE